MARTKDLAMIHGAAFYFAHVSRDKKKIANHFGVTERTIERWSKEPEWEQALNAWGYTDDRSFTSPPRRDIAHKSRGSYQKAKAIYIEAQQAGEPHHKLATIVGEATGLPPATIRRWAMKHRWRDYYSDSNVPSGEIETFIGVSGTPYQFECYHILSEFPGVGAVFIFTKRRTVSGKNIHEPLYIGQTGSLESSFYDPKKFDCVKKKGGNTICIHPEKTEFLRFEKESDLIAVLNPICNE